MKRRSTPVRRGFTLLEVLLASLIATILLGALYVVMDITLRQTQVSRDTVEEDNLSRGVFNRLTIDLAASLGPLPPKCGGNSGTGTSSGSSSGSSGDSSDSSGATSGSTTGTSSSSTSSSSTSSTASSSTSSSSTDDGSGSSSSSSSTPQAADVGFQAGIVGDSTTLTVFVSRLPSVLANTGELIQWGNSQAPSAPVSSDLSRITYWLGQNGGLCRQERPWVTADGIRDTFEPDLSNEAGDMLAEEVTNLTFEYFDGTDWTSTWNGYSPGPDGITPLGPPRAVRVTLTLSLPSTQPGRAPVQKQVSQVIPIRAAPGTNTPPLIQPSTDAGTVSSDSSSSSSGGTGSGQSSGQSGGGGTQTSPSGGTSSGGGSTGSASGGTSGSKSSGGGR